MDEKQARLFFDIETVGDPKAVKLLPVPEAPSNYKDELKIAAYIAQKKADQRAKAALDPDTGKVVALGYAFAWDDTPVALIARTLPQEKKLLKKFWGAVAECHGFMVGFNILGFDLPFLLRRSFGLKVPVGQILNLARYQTEPITDLFKILNNWAPGGKGLKFLADRYKLEVRAPGVDGSMVEDLDDLDLAEYVGSDVWVVGQMWQRSLGIYL